MLVIQPSSRKPASRKPQASKPHRNVAGETRQLRVAGDDVPGRGAGAGGRGYWGVGRASGAGRRQRRRRREAVQRRAGTCNVRQYYDLIGPKCVEHASAAGRRQRQQWREAILALRWDLRQNFHFCVLTCCTPEKERFQRWGPPRMATAFARRYSGHT